jgi:hypothetical protein
MWLILVGAVVFVIAISLIPHKHQEQIAKPKESERLEPDICDELNELESKILRYPDGRYVGDSEYNQRIFTRQHKIINDYYKAGVDIDMDIATQRWKIKE